MKKILFGLIIIGLTIQTYGQIRTEELSEVVIYYDFSSRNYLYLDNGIWITVDVLPQRFNHIDLRRSHRVRINNYFGDDIKRYHNENRRNINRSITKRRTPANIRN